MIKNTDNYFKIRERGNTPMTTESIKSMQVYDRSPNSNLTYDEQQAALDKQIEEPQTLTEDDEKDLENDVKTYVDANKKGNEDLLGGLQELEKTNKTMKKILGALQAFVDCNRK